MRVERDELVAFARLPPDVHIGMIAVETILGWLSGCDVLQVHKQYTSRFAAPTSEPSGLAVLGCTQFRRSGHM